MHIDRTGVEKYLDDIGILAEYDAEATEALPPQRWYEGPACCLALLLLLPLLAPFVLFIWLFGTKGECRNGKCSR